MPNSMMDLLRHLYPLHLAPVSPDMAAFRNHLDAELAPFTNDHYYSFPSRMRNANGWIVPDSWAPGGELGLGAVISSGSLRWRPRLPGPPVGYSLPFMGTVPGKELKAHLYTHRGSPRAIPYHCDWYYKPHLRDWGIAVNGRFFRSVQEDEKYVVDVRVHSEPGEMEVLTYTVEGLGDTGETFVFQAHNCHTHQADDDLSGVVVGVELMKRISALRPRNTYVLLICPEHLGTVFFLGSTDYRKKTTGVLFLEGLGGKRPLRLQESFWGNGVLDHAVRTVLGGTSYPFRSIVGNDEVVWEAPGVEVPCSTLTRFPTSTYHMLNLDTPDSLIPGSLEGSVEMLVGVVGLLEGRNTLRNTYRDLVCLSNPKFDLYLPPGNDPSTGVVADRSWNLLMTFLPRYIAAGWGVEQIAERHGKTVKEVKVYLEKWKERGLVEERP